VPSGDFVVTVRFPAAEVARLDRIAAGLGLDRSKLLRQWAEKEMDAAERLAALVEGRRARSAVRTGRG
jgi:predicted transcriptional regulator